MIERDIVAEFTAIIEQYKTSPFGFRLRKTGNILKLAEYNGLFYIDMINLYKITNELLGPNIPEEMIEFLTKITFSELITLECNNRSETKPMTCIQFIDSTFFNNCINWIDQQSENKSEEYGMLFNSFFTETEQKNQQFVSNMMPFQDFLFQKENVNSPTETQRYDKIQGKMNSNRKPRGKQMEAHNDSAKERPFICEIPFCERAFKRFEHLKRHMKMHTGDRPFKCNFPGCYKSFSRSDNLNQHQKTHGSAINAPSSIRFQNETTDMMNFRIED